MQKVVKFGGSSLANATQFKKVKNIIEADSARNVVVVSALGKRNKEDHKITDLLYLTAAHLKYSVDALSVFNIIKERYFEVCKELELDIDLETEFKEIESHFSKNVDEEYLVSRGEYLAAKMMAKYLDYKFVDAKDIICFNFD
jgi:aspartate kinase